MRVRQQSKISFGFQILFEKWAIDAGMLVLLRLQNLFTRRFLEWGELRLRQQRRHAFKLCARSPKCFCMPIFNVSIICTTLNVEVYSQYAWKRPAFARVCDVCKFAIRNRYIYWKFFFRGTYSMRSRSSYCRHAHNFIVIKCVMCFNERLYDNKRIHVFHGTRLCVLNAFLTHNTVLLACIFTDSVCLHSNSRTIHCW